MKQIQNVMMDLLILTVGSALYSFSVHYFTAPNHVAPGGVTGIATLLNYLFPGVPIGLTSLVFNIPLLIMGFIYLGHPFVWKTAYCLVVCTLFIDVLFKNIPVFENNMLLASIFGGVVMGIGLAMIFMRNSSTGGTDIGAKLLQLRFPHMSIGNLMLCIDVMVVFLAAVIYRKIDAALYAIICIFASTKIIDTILYGQELSKQVMIITSKPQAVTKTIIERVDRGVTLLDGKGGYTREQKEIVLCVIRRTEFYTMKRLVHEIDPDAFMIVTDAGEVLGNGFKSEK